MKIDLKTRVSILRDGYKLLYDGKSPIIICLAATQKKSGLLNSLP